MATYAIGDVQGCYEPLMRLLEKIKFDPSQDTLWFVGDLVNRGPDSLLVLRFIKSLNNQQITVLGNHDLHLLAVYHGVRENKHDTFHDVLTAADQAELIEWLSRQPLFYYDRQLNYGLVHAGLAPEWDVDKITSLSQEVGRVLQNQSLRIEFLNHMYGNEPARWSDELTGFARLRTITNYLTRLRYCYDDGRMDFAYKGEIHSKPPELIPWYQLANRQSKDINIIFGHWAALAGTTNWPNTHALDTGCIWGKCLTAMRLEDKQRFHTKCSPKVGAAQG